ncbi:monovalent cation/H(+) antiporter subunit G [Vibrio cholerae]|uniref:monovalent cation/H(+) antiporter subunit G n=1 Tax=Vibrio cholerae TaxID=666 RepID=UPI0030FDFB44
MSMLAALLLVLGTLFTLFASLGILRMPDLYTRMHAATKVGTAGLSLLLLAVALCMPEIGVISRLVGIMLFIFLTAPVAAHLLGKVTQQVGYAFWRNQDAAKQKKAQK